MTFDLKKAVHHSVLASPLWRCTRGSEQGQRNYGSYLCWQKKAECESLQSAKLGRYLEKDKILINSFEFFSVPPFLSSARVSIHAERSLNATCICPSARPPACPYPHNYSRKAERFSLQIYIAEFYQKSDMWFNAMFCEFSKRCLRQ